MRFGYDEIKLSDDALDALFRAILKVAVENDLKKVREIFEQFKINTYIK